jgi:hypothetical protein
MKNIKILTLFISVFSLSTVLFANEQYMTRAQALAKGYRPRFRVTNEFSGRMLPAHSLKWPVQFVDANHTIGNSMPEYQNYDTEAYYHGGSDLRVAKQGEVTAPVDGFLQGDYYSYVTDPDTGQDQKFTKPVISVSDDLYFEITITTADHFRLELHHVDSRTVPATILKMIMDGGGPVHQGEVVGKASLWPIMRLGARYDHIHYNLISPEGILMNPEFFSSDILDTSAPVVKNIYAVYGTKKMEVLGQKLQGLPTELIISTYDLKASNMYQLPPTFIEAKWNEFGKVGWDFTQFLVNSLGSFPDLREVYARNVRLNDGRVVSTSGDYDSTEFLFRLKIPVTATLPIMITVKDVSGNATQVQLN